MVIQYKINVYFIHLYNKVNILNLKLNVKKENKHKKGKICICTTEAETALTFALTC